MVKVFEAPWPGNPVRVDIVAYANWAGAYTTIEPTRPTISSLVTGAGTLVLAAGLVWEGVIVAGGIIAGLVAFLAARRNKTSA